MKILVTGCGAPGGPGIIRELVRAGYEVYGTDTNIYSSGQVFCKDFKINVGHRDPHFIDDIFRICKSFDIQIIIPLVTLELELFARNKEAFFAKGIRVIVSELSTLAATNDKGNLYKEFSDFSFIPSFEVCNEEKELISKVENYLLHKDSVVIKPTISNGSRGVRIVNRTYDGYKALMESKPGDLNISIHQLKDLVKNKNIPPFLVSEYLPGEEFTCDVIFREGIPLLLLVRERIAMRLGISVTGKFVENAFVKNHIEVIGNKFSMNGPIGFQFKLDESGTPKLLEINPRFQGTSVASKGLGINYADEVIKVELNTSYVPAINYEPGLIFTRYYEEIFF